LSASAAPKVFISYRREETAGHAGRLYDVMSSRFGHANVFMDVDMAPGVDFVERIKDAVGGCHVLLVIIGPRWSTITNGSIAPRLADPGDFVRLEVEEGLRRADVSVIPVLVGGARMPGPSELPKELHPLSRRNALELSDSRWRYDVDRLLGTLDRLLAGTSAVTPRPGAIPAVRQPPPAVRPPERRTPSRFGLALSTALIAAAAGLVARGVCELVRAVPQYAELNSNGHPIWSDVKPVERAKVIADGLLRSGFTWAVVAAAVAVWLTLRLRNSNATVGGRVVSGVLVGGLGGIVGSAIHAVPTNLVKVRQLPEDRRHLLLILSVAVTGAIVGAFVGWVWRRRGSAGLAAGLVAGAVEEALVIKTGWSGPHDFPAKAAVAGFVIVGFVALTQALLDGAAERSPRALATSRGP
jgi:hypothetical protein